MATRAKKTMSEDVPAFQPQTSPSYQLSGHGDHSFTLQAVMEMQKTLGELNSKFDNLNKTIESTKTKVDDLVSWKNRILGGAFMLGIVATLLGVLLTKGWDYISIKAPENKPQNQIQNQPMPEIENNRTEPISTSKLK